MSRGVSDKITYKPYNQGEQWLLPPSLEELVPQNHFVRIVSKTVDELEIEKVFARNTKGGGASRYNPVMLLKVLIYCYMTGTYSSRQIAKQCRENVNVMWLTGFQKPDFRTVNTFRSEKLKDSIEEIFVSTVKLLNMKGYVSLEKYFVDGTKIESAANKYTFREKRNTRRLTPLLIGHGNRNLCAFAFFSKEVYLTAQGFDTGLDVFKAEVIFRLEGAF